MRTGDLLSVMASLEQLNKGGLASEPASFNDALKGRLHLAHVGLMGHSFGGATALQGAALHPSFRCALALDAWVFAMDADLKRQGVCKPFLCLQTSHFFYQGDNDKVVEAMVQRSKEALGEQGARLGRVAGASHYDFTDLPFWAPLLSRRVLKLTSLPGPVMHEVVGAYARALFAQHLRGGCSAEERVLLLGERRFEGVSYQ